MVDQESNDSEILIDDIPGSFIPRDYQKDIYKALEIDHKRKIMLVWSRRAGKDLCVFNLMIRQCLLRTCLIVYCLPVRTQAKDVIFDGITNTGQKFLSYIPKEFLADINLAELKIKFTNGSILQLASGNNFDHSLIGKNPYGVVFSEAAVMDDVEHIYTLTRPILAANDGFVIFVSTPRGKTTTFWNVYQQALAQQPDWHVSVLTAEQTKHISLDILEAERKTMDPGLFAQEYLCSFEYGQQGLIYTNALQKLKLDGRYTVVNYDPTLLTNVCMDIGVSDNTALIWWQQDGPLIKIIDCHFSNGLGLDYYAKMILQDKPYRLGTVYFCHDMRVREFGNGAMTRLTQAHQLGLNGVLLDQFGLEDGIANVLMHFPAFWINSLTCQPLLDALENYKREYDPVNKIYKKPIHNWASDMCFIGETLIATDKGEVKIKNIKIGDKVKTPSGFKKVTAVHSRLTNDLANLFVGNTKITTTPQHNIFTNRGLVGCDSLRYPDIMEYNSLISGLLWKMIFTFFGKEYVLKGFKKSFLSLKTERKLSLMGIFLDGLVNTIYPPKLHLRKVRPFIDIFGLTIKEKYQRAFIYITSMAILRTMRLKICSVFRPVSTYQYIQTGQNIGHSQMSVKNFSNHTVKKQKNGIEVKREENGIKNTRLMFFRFIKVSNMTRFVWCAKKIFWGICYGKNFVLTHVKQKIESFIKKTLFIGLVVFVKLYSFVINTLLRKHVVRNVIFYRPPKQKLVYDLTVEADNCYYANGYLVSNSDSLRYLCQAIDLAKPSDHANVLKEAKREMLYGNKRSFLPGTFQKGY